MQIPDESPTFNLKAVVQETGLKHDTLRAWERRYGIPQPDRTAGGHRLYSQRDIDILKWLVARQNEGLSISRAVDLWRKLQKEGQDPLQEMGPPPPAPTVEPAIPAYISSGGTIKEMRQAWLEACLNFDEKQAEQILAQSAALYSPEVLCFEFLQKGLSEIGQMWMDGAATVQQEHFATALAIRRLETLIVSAPNPTRPGKILVVCPPEELHVFSLLLATFLLRRNGWDTIYLGANVPVAHISETVAKVKPNLVIMAAQQLHTAATLLDTAQRLDQEQIPVAYGGLIFNVTPSVRSRIPGYFLGETMEHLVQIVENILNQPSPTIQAKPVSDQYKTALAHYRGRYTLIESFVWEHVNKHRIPQPILSEWNLTASRNIIAALKLGSMDYLGNELNWAQELIINHECSENTLDYYLNIYHEAAKNYLDERGTPIINWLATFNRANE